MRLGFVFTSIVLALALGTIAGAAESRLLTRTLVIAFVPAIWAVSYVVARLTGRDMWHFVAPYPYRWMRERGEAIARPIPVQKQIEDRQDTDGRSTLPLAA